MLYGIQYPLQLTNKLPVTLSNTYATGDMFMLQLYAINKSITNIYSVSMYGLADKGNTLGHPKLIVGLGSKGISEFEYIGR